MKTEAVVLIVAAVAIAGIGYMLTRPQAQAARDRSRGPAMPADDSVSWIRGAVDKIKGSLGGSGGSGKGSDPSDYSAATLAGWTPDPGPTGDYTLTLGAIAG